MELPNTSLQTIALKPSFSGQAHLKRSGTGLGYENTDSGYFFPALRVLFLIRPLRIADMPFQAGLCARFRTAGPNGA